MSKGSDVMDVVVGLVALVCVFASVPVSWLVTVFIAYPAVLNALGSAATSDAAVWILFGVTEALLVGAVLWAAVACRQDRQDH